MDFKFAYNAKIKLCEIIINEIQTSENDIKFKTCVSLVLTRFTFFCWFIDILKQVFEEIASQVSLEWIFKSRISIGQLVNSLT